MRDPVPGASNYCDMAATLIPGFEGGLCTELDILEGNRHVMQSTIHTEYKGRFGSGKCDSNGCFSRVGGPMSPLGLRDSYGPDKRINSNSPFEVRTEVDGDGAMQVTLVQGAHQVVVFNKQMAGNPQATGVPPSALRVTAASMGKLALVASLWTAPDTSWLDGPNCDKCDVETATFTISNLHSYKKPPPPHPPTSPSPPFPPPPPPPPPPTPSSPPPFPESPPSPPKWPPPPPPRLPAFRATSGPPEPLEQQPETIEATSTGTNAVDDMSLEDEVPVLILGSAPPEVSKPVAGVAPLAAAVVAVFFFIAWLAFRNHRSARGRTRQSSTAMFSRLPSSKPKRGFHRTARRQGELDEDDQDDYDDEHPDGGGLNTYGIAFKDDNDDEDDDEHDDVDDSTMTDARHGVQQPLSFGGGHRHSRTSHPATPNTFVSSLD